ncbi:MAG: patatin family protein [Bdellovibrionales bacterium]|nr:patatin family protein [Bdellovibrionales bacterium]
MKQQEITDLIHDTKNSGGKVAVVVEGGGLRGVVSACMLKVLDDLGLGPKIDAVSGTSAGAINLCYFLNGNITKAIELYKVLASKEFIQPLKWPNAMNLDYLFNEQIKNHYPIDWTSLRNHPTDFFISMTHAQTGQGHFMRAQDTIDDGQLLSAVRASASAPLFTTHREIIDGEPYNDGQVQYSIPHHIFDDKDFDLVLCLLTRPRGYRKSNSLVGNLLEKAALRNYKNEYKMSFAQTATPYNSSLDLIFQNHQEKYKALVIEPEDHVVSKMSRDPTHVQKCIDSTLSRFTK